MIMYIVSPLLEYKTDMEMLLYHNYWKCNKSRDFIGFKDTCWSHQQNLKGDATEFPLMLFTRLDSSSYLYSSQKRIQGVYKNLST